MERIEKSVKTCANPELAEILKTAGAAALEAGRIIRDLYGTPHQIRHKGATDLVTEADVASENAILAILQAFRPEWAILAEESHPSYTGIPIGPAWVIDPLDGTTNFAHGFPHFAVSIGYVVDGISMAGVVYCPMRNELFSAWRGGGAWLNGEPIRVSTTSLLLQALMATGFPCDIQKNLQQLLHLLAHILPQIQNIRRAGAAALDLAYVACGRLDGFWEMDLKPWDTAAGWLLVEEAGGTVTDFHGAKFSPFTPEVLATNTLLHPKLLPFLRC